MRSLRTYFSTHRLLSTVVAGTAILVIATGIAYGVISTSTPSHAGATNPPTSLTTPTTAAGGQAPATAPAQRRVGHRRRALRGTLTAVSAQQWTVRTASGVTVAVHVTPATTYDTPAKPASASSLVAGDEVVVVGVRQGDIMTATRIAIVPTGRLAPATTTPAPATTTPAAAG